MFFSRKLYLSFSFVALYLILIGTIFYFYTNILADYNKDLQSTKNKIVGVKYLKLLHELSITTVELQDKKIKNKSIQKNIEAIHSFQKKYPKFYDRRLNKHLEFLEKSYIDYSDSDFYDFLDFINNENYRVGNKAEILFSKDKQRYFLGTLITHYLPELFISIGISNNLLERLLKDGYLHENKINIFIEQNKLINLSSEEVHNIINLLDKESSKNLFKTIEEFRTTLDELKINKNKLTIFNGNTVDLKSKLSIMQKLVEISEKLNNQNTKLLERSLYNNQKYLNDKVTQYALLMSFIILIVTAIFIYSFHILNSNIKKDKQLLKQSRLAQMGEMISMIAHQWRQPLGAISTTATNLEIKIELESFNLDTKEGQIEQNRYFLKELDNINAYVQNLTRTIDDFRNFYKPNKERVEIKLQDIVKKSLVVIEASIKCNDIELIQEYNDDEPLKLHNGEMMQVILNILKNAQDNFKEKETKSPQIRITTQERGISICDNGGGIPEDIIDKIFDPYFSTKDEKNGTGLGLYMSKMIVEEHHDGTLHVENINDGVCFRIELNKRIENG